MNTFNKVPLKDVCKVISGYAFKSASFKAGGDTPVIKIKNIKIGTASLEDAGYVNSTFLEKIDDKFRVTADDVLISLTGSHMTQPNSVVGRVGRYPNKYPVALLNQRAGKIIPNEARVDKSYLFYSLLGDDIRKEIAQMAHGAASQANVSPTQVESIEIPLPDLKSQRKIGGVLQNYDNLIENNNRRIAILENMAQSLYREWFVNFRYPNHEDNLDADGKTKLIDSPLGQIPEGWGVVALEDLCNKITDGSHKSPKSVDVGVPMASVKDMHDFGINASKCRQISYEDYEDLKRQDSVVKANDILVAKDGSYLKHTFVVEKELEMALLSSIAIIRPNDKVKPHWLAYCLRSPLVKERMKNYVSGAAIPRIILKDFRKFNLFIPPQELMDEWNSIVEGMVKQCWNLVARNENLKQQRDMLLPKLISGQIEL